MNLSVGFDPSVRLFRRVQRLLSSCGVHHYLAAHLKQILEEQVASKRARFERLLG